MKLVIASLMLMLFPLSFAYEYPPQKVEQYIQGCSSACGAKVGQAEVCQKICECTIEEYQKDMSYKKFVNVQKQLEANSRDALTQHLKVSAYCGQQVMQ